MTKTIYKDQNIARLLIFIHENLKKGDLNAELYLIDWYTHCWITLLSKYRLITDHWLKITVNLVDEDLVIHDNSDESQTSWANMVGDMRNDRKRKSLLEGTHSSLKA